MHSGLEKILVKISEDPSNKVLTNRYVALVSELPNDMEKVKYMLKLSFVLIEPDPRSAMEFAFSVFQYDQSNVEALETISTCLKTLGRHGKSEVIKNEIAKIRKLQEQNKIDFDLAEKFVTEVSAIRIEHPEENEGQAVPFTPVPDDAFIPAGLNESNDPKVTVPINQFHPKPMPKPAYADIHRPQQDQVKLDLQLPISNKKPKDAPEPSAARPTPTPEIPLGGTVVQSQEHVRSLQRLQNNISDKPDPMPSELRVEPAQVPSVDIQIEEEAAKSSIALDQNKNIDEVPPIIEDSTVVKKDNIPNTDIPRGLPPEPNLSTKTAANDPEIEVLVEQFEFFYKQKMFVEADKTLRRSENFAASMPWWRARRAILDSLPLEKQLIDIGSEDNLQSSQNQPLPADLSSMGSDSDLSQEIERWSKEMTGLIQAGKSRKALTLIRECLTGKSNIAWGMQAMELLDQIWNELGLQSFTWDPNEGMSVLNARLKKRQPVKLASLLQNPRRKNSA